MGNWQVRVTVNSSGGRVRVPAGATWAKPGTFVAGGSAAFRQGLREANRFHAAALQADVVENVQRGIMRRTVSSGRLVAVTGDPQNRDSDEFGYGVGRIDYLDRSMAKYWRQIEEGYTGHVGRVLNGFWGAGIRRVSADRVWASGPWHRHGKRRSDMFVPATGLRNSQGRFASAEFDEEVGAARKAPNFARRTTIKNPIEAHWDYREAFNNYQPGARGLEDIQNLLRFASEAAWGGRATRAGYLY